MKIDLDHIKVKPFFKVLETGNFHHFTKSKRKAIEPIWDELLEAYEKLSGNRKTNKEISTRARIEGLICKFKAINIACDCLAFKYEEDALEILKEHYFFINNSNYNKELERIKKESESILIQVEKLKKQLPKEETSNKRHIDEIILGYCSFLGIQVKPNDCTVTEFKALEKLFENKLKQLEKNGK